MPLEGTDAPVLDPFPVVTGALVPFAGPVVPGAGVPLEGTDAPVPVPFPVVIGALVPFAGPVVPGAGVPLEGTDAPVPVPFPEVAGAPALFAVPLPSPVPSVSDSLYLAISLRVPNLASNIPILKAI